MARKKTHIILGFILLAVFIFIAGAGGYLVWLSRHYRQIVMQRLPEMVAKSTDSIYHISFSDINISLYDRHITITDMKLWPDMEQVKALKEQHRRIPPTLSTVSIPLLEAYGIRWEDLVGKRSLDCRNAVVHDLKWLLVCKPAHPDSTLIRDKHSTPYIGRITVATADFVNPDVTYEYKGENENFTCYMKGGTARLNSFAYNNDQAIDTSVFLFARSGKVRFNSFIFSKPAGKYTVKAPLIDFESTANTVTLKGVKIKHMTDNDQRTGKEKENYDIEIPATELVGFNWNRLINSGELFIPRVNTTGLSINIHYIRANATKGGRKGSYPNQLLLLVGLKTNIEEVNIKKGYFKYTEVTPKGDEGTVVFSNISSKFSNITNIPEVIASHKSCIVNLEGKFMDKSDVNARFDLSLTDNTGRFKMDGKLNNMDGDEITQQVQVFTFIKVTSFHLNRMDMHIEGDETYGKGDFTVLYRDLKISLLKFDTKRREGKKGTLAFLGSTLLLYPSNPMPDKDVRKVSTSFARDTTKGFISLLWQNMYRAAKKTAVREQAIVTLTDGPETSKGEQPKKGFFKRLLGKKK